MSFERIMGLNVIDEQEYQLYRAAMEPMLNRCGGAFGYDFRVSEVLRSKTPEPINRVFTIEFPSQQAMQDFFQHPDYLAIQARHFQRAVGSRTVIAMHEKTELL